MNKIVTTIEICSNTIKFVQADVSPAKNRLLSLEEIPFANQDELIAVLGVLASKYKISKTSLVTVLPRYQVFLKKITVPPGDSSEIRNILQYEAERYLPFPQETAAIDFCPIKPLSVSSSNDIYLIAAKRETIDKHLELFRSAGLLPDVISSTSLALKYLFACLQDDQETLALINLDNNNWEINIFSQKQLLLSRGFSLSPAQNKSDYLPTIQSEVSNSFNMLNSYKNHATIDKIYYSIPKDISYPANELPNAFNIPLFELSSAKIGNLFEISENITPETLQSYFVPLGLILSSGYQPNLMPKDIQDSISKKRTQKLQIATAIGIIAGLIILFAALFGIKYYKSSLNRDIVNRIEQNKQEILELSRIQKQLEIINSFKIDNTLSLDILKEISTVLPHDVFIKQYNYDYNENTVTIRCRAGSYTVASKTVSSLGKIKYLEKVSNKGSYMIKIGDKGLVDFEVSCTLKKSL